jgi:hypothetical protein
MVCIMDFNIFVNANNVILNYYLILNTDQKLCMKLRSNSLIMINNFYWYKFKKMTDRNSHVYLFC